MPLLNGGAAPYPGAAGGSYKGGTADTSAAARPFAGKEDAIFPVTLAGTVVSCARRLFFSVLQLRLWQQFPCHAGTPPPPPLCYIYTVPFARPDPIDLPSPM